MSRAEAARHRSWPVPAALLVLSAIPLSAGTLRLIQLAGGPAVIPADHRFASFPLRAIFGTGLLAADLAKGAAWVINLGVAEWAISGPARRRPTPSPVPQHAGARS